MPVQACEANGRPGYQWGEQGKCYTYTPGDEASRNEAKRKAHVQGAAIGESQMLEQLYEIVQSPDLRVDRENGVIRNVRILGERSMNGRKYTQEAVAKAASLYEGRQANYDHPSRINPEQERTVADRAGWFENVRKVDGGLNADFFILTSDPRADKVFESAERNPKLFGFSHNAEGKTRRDGAQVLVEEITRVRSVDLVADPATTKSLFESQFCSHPLTEWLDELYPNKRNLIDQLIEQGMITPEMQAESTAVSDSAMQMRQAFRVILLAVIDDDSLDMKQTLSKIKEVLQAQEKLMAPVQNDNQNPEEPEEEEPMADEQATAVQDKEEKDEKPTFESLGAEITSLKENNTKLSEQIESLKEQLKETPRGGIVTGSAGGNGKAAAPKDAAEFVARIRG